MSRSAILHDLVRQTVRAVMLASVVVGFFSFPDRAHAQWSLSPLSSFGASGWLSGTAFGANGTNGAIRSMAYNATTGNVLIANGSTVQIVNGTTGAVGSLLNATGLSGGTRTLSTVTVTTDGAIYGSNLVTSSTASPFKIYRWANEAAAPTTFYSGNAGVSTSARAGDSLVVYGNDASGMLAFGTGTINSGTTPTSFYSLLQTNSGVPGAATAMSGTGAVNASFRTGLAFLDSDTILGLASGGATSNSVVSGTSGSWTFDGFRTVQNVNERSISVVTNVFGTPLLATMQLGGNGGTLLTSTNTVRIYDATDFATSGLGTPLATANIAVGSIANGNGNVGIAFGTVNGDPVLYALNANNGIQAFQIVPEPTTATIAGVCSLGLAALMLRRRRKGLSAAAPLPDET
jgi:hypothetical protein